MHHFEDVDDKNVDLNKILLKAIKKARDVQKTRTSIPKFDFSPVEPFFFQFDDAAKNKIIWTALDYLRNEQKDWINYDGGGIPEPVPPSIDVVATATRTVTSSRKVDGPNIQRWQAKNGNSSMALSFISLENLGLFVELSMCTTPLGV